MNSNILNGNIYLNILKLILDDSGAIWNNRKENDMAAAYEYFTNQKQWEQYLKDLVKSNDNALIKAIVCIYDRQTPDEKNADETIDENGIGFSKVDAYEMGKIARKIKNGENLTKGELAKSRNKMQKYWKQLMTISKQRLEERKQEQQNELNRKLSEEADAAAKEENERLNLFREHIETLRKCSEEGISCEYGICDECPLTAGFQIRLNL